MIRPTLFCFGLGYCARRLARRLADRGWTVGGTVRAPADPDADGFSPLPFGPGQPLAAGALSRATHLLISIPPGPDDHADPVLDHCRAALETAPCLQWIGYLSTTGVYGDHQGGRVDETTPPAPGSARAARRVTAETAWLEMGRRLNVPTQIFRLAGIYGPGRSVLDDLRRGTAQRIIKPGQVFSRIHVDDVATVLEASMARPRAGAVYNVCDDEAAPPQDVVAFGAGLLKLPPPPDTPFAEAALSAMAQSFWADNKRVDNRLLHQELGVRLAYPSYREGLAACT
ncbi:NAD dependent epimerase/dehydratase family protein [mine drainage metagenome]|uniref:NAD dependent epimerase/dehydratase family protein n=1 Tax=mine drainage metagenome TaxID=410659 RepID=A0A1J5SV74_9ZZZZ